MKKFWKIKNDNNIKEIFIILSLPENYIDRLFSVDSHFYEYLQHSEPDFFYMTYESRKKKNSNGGFCWCGKYVYLSFNKKTIINGYDYFIKEKYKYKGEVNLRKIKLERFNKKEKKKWWVF